METRTLGVKSGDFSPGSDPYSSVLGPLSSQRQSKSMLQNNNPTPVAARWNVSEMVNPDGSVTIRRKVLHTDGSRILEEESFPLDNRRSKKGDNAARALPSLTRTTSDSDSSDTTAKTTPSRNTMHLLSNRNGQGSAFSRHQKLKMLLDKPIHQPTKSQVELQNPDFRRSTSRGASEKVTTFHTGGPKRVTQTLSPPTVSRWHLQPATKLQNREELVQNRKVESVHNKVVYHKNLDTTGTSHRPANPVPFERTEGEMPSFNPTKSYVSTNSSTFDGNDISGISWDSMGYPMLDTSTVLHESAVVEEEKEDSDDNSDWSMLRDDSVHSPMEFPGGSRHDPLRQGIQQRTNPHAKDAPQLVNNPRVTNMQKSLTEVSSQPGRLVFQQAPILMVPTPRNPNSGTSSRGGAFSSGATTTDELRDRGNLLDSRSVNTYEAEHESIHRADEVVVYSVRKTTPDDKIGIFVGLKQLECGIRLVVTKVSPHGKFAESPIERGDIVLSINGTNFLQNPNSDLALDIVRRAREKVTFTVQKWGDLNDNGSIDELSLPSLPYHHVSEMVNPDLSKTLTREVWNSDGSQTIVSEFFDHSGRKLQQLTRRRCFNSDGSPLEVSRVSLSISGEMTILVKKIQKQQIVGLKLSTKLNHRGQNALTVVQVFPSGLFARTPLSEGDTILSINNIDFRENPDARVASSVISRVDGNLTIQAIKSSDWMQGKNQRLAQTRRLVETFKIPAPASKMHEYDEISYGGSLHGYESAKTLKFRKQSKSENLGIAISGKPTRMGTLPVVTNLVPFSILALSGLQEGDVVLAVNGVNVRDETGTQRAMTLLNEAEGEIVVEYQHMASMENGGDDTQVEITESFKPDGTKCIRTETKNPDGSILVKLEEIGPAVPVDATVEEGRYSQKSASGGNSSHSRSDAHAGTKSTERTSNVTHISGVEFVVVTVTKSHPAQEVGITVATVDGILYVAKVSPSGLLVGKPVLPGDTILAINGQSFRNNPSAREAHAMIVGAPKTIEFDILKTSSHEGLDGTLDVKKKRLYERLMCKKHTTTGESRGAIRSVRNGFDSFNA